MMNQYLEIARSGRAAQTLFLLFGVLAASLIEAAPYQPPPVAKAPAKVDYTVKPELPGKVDLRPQMKVLENWRQAEYQRLRASGKATAADFKAVDDKYLTRARKAEGFRTDALNKLNQNTGIEVKQGAGGTKPTEGRGLGGDIDTDSLSAKNFKKVQDTAEKMGYKVTHHGDAITIEELNVTVHRQSAAEAKTASRVGSSAHGAEIRRGFNEETALGFKANNPSASVSDNLKKAAHTLDMPPGKLDPADVQKLGKMTGRNLEELGKLDPAAAKKYETLQKQAEMLKKGYSPEAAGIEDLGKFQQQAKEASVKAVKATEGWAESKTTELTQRARSAEDALKQANKSGDPVRIQEARVKVVEAKTDLIGFKETQAAAREAAVLNKTNGEAATKIMGEAKGIPEVGKSPSTVREQILSGDRKIISKTVSEPPIGAGKAAAGEAAATGVGAKAMKGAMGIMVIYGIITGVKEGAAQAGEEAAKGDSALTSILKTAGYSIWHGLGFGAAQQTGKSAGEASAQQWADDVKAGRVDPNSKLSQAWAKLRGVGWGLADFTGLTAIKDAAVEGGGYVKDRYTQYKAEKDQAKQQQDVADKKAGQASADKKDDKTIQGQDKPGSDKTTLPVSNLDRAAADKAAKDKADKEKAGKEKAEKEKADKDKAAKEKADKERQARERAREKAAKEKAAKEKAEKERQAKERAEAEKKAAAAKAAAAQKAAAQQAKPAIPPGTHEEVSGTATNASGSTKLTYIKDAAGNILGGYYTNYDKNGKETGKEYFKNKPDGNSPSPATKVSYDGSYSGRTSGGAGGSMSFTVKGGRLNGRVSGSYQGDPFTATISGSVDASGNVRASISGAVRGALGDKGKVESWEFGGTMSGRIVGNAGSGSWSAAGFGKSAGSWSVSR